MTPHPRVPTLLPTRPPILPCSTLVVTEECLLHPSRNPHYGKAGIEAVLKEYLGLEKVRGVQRMPPSLPCRPAAVLPSSPRACGSTHLGLCFSSAPTVATPDPQIIWLWKGVAGDDSVVNGAPAPGGGRTGTCRTAAGGMALPQPACSHPPHALSWPSSPAPPARRPPPAGHVDNFCCFIAPGVVALAWPNDENE